MSVVIITGGASGIGLATAVSGTGSIVNLSSVSGMCGNSG